jgi:CTP:molybdopterin cytidylyltransferase MocA
MKVDRAQVVSSDCTTVVVDDDGQPRSSSLAVLLDQLDAQLRMICLPDGV